MAEKQISKKRWHIAQNSEREFWEEWTTQSLKEKCGIFFKNKLKKNLSLWKKYFSIENNTKILQVGCGPLDIINYLEKGDKYSIDPLANFYKKRFDFDYRSSKLKEAPGESIPYEDKFFDIVIMSNAIDHTHKPEVVLKELSRVLKDEGIIHLEVEVYQKSFLFISKIWSLFRKIFYNEIWNIHHPHMYFPSKFDKLVEKEFIILQREIQSKKEIKETRKKDKPILKFLAKVGILANMTYTLICKKRKKIKNN